MPIPTATRSVSIARCCRNSLAIAAMCIAFGIPAAVGQTYRVIYAFSGRPDGEAPQGDLSIDKNGNLFGTTTLGGRGGLCHGDGCGMVFKLAPQGSDWKLTQLYAFQGDTDGAFPLAGVIIGPDRNLYGATQQGGNPGCDDNCGTVFSLAASTSSKVIEMQLHRFTGGTDGIFPGFGQLAVGRQGRLYGTTQNGGIHGFGTVYELGITNGIWTEKVLHAFDNVDSGFPFAGVVLDQIGNLYGTTTLGPLGFGTVFEMVHGSSGWIEKTLYTFTNDTDGSFPMGGLIVDNLGNLYGTTEQGGSGGVGTIFELTPNSDGSWTFHLLYSFSGNGGGPVGRLARDAAGNLYGTTNGLGAHFDGSVFRLTRRGTFDYVFTSLHDFSGGSDGNVVYAGVTLDSQGNVFGVTGQGGSGACSGNGCGVIFEITP
jgi:uncharacterized repeat protein (TIGR03803 family)